MMKDYLSGKKIRKSFLLLTATLLFDAITTIALLKLWHLGFSEINVVVIYIVTVLITSHFTQGYFYGIIASVVSTFAFNFFFTEPLYSFKVDDSTNIVILIVMLFSSVFTSMQASKLIRSKKLANERERQAQILYRVTSLLAKTSEIPEVATVAIRFLIKLFRCDRIAIILSKKGSKPLLFMVDKDSQDISCREAEDAKIEEISGNCYVLPIKIRDQQNNIICLPKAFEKMDKEDKFLLDSITIQIAIAIERVILIREKETAKSEIEQERFKSNLLRSISHDIRTPLTRIIGTSEILYHNLSKDNELNLVSEINDDANWLMRLIENILSLTRIQEGRLAINIQEEAVEEVIAGAIGRTAKFHSDRNINIVIPDEVLFVPMDGKLIEQVLINLINNAVEHTRANEDITLSVYPDKDKVWFDVSDKGVGIKDEDLPKIFDIFFVSDNAPEGKHGMGLGLAICKAIVNYHKGEIFALNNPDQGATFRFYLKKDRIT